MVGMENVLERTRREPQPGSWDRKGPGARWGGWTGVESRLQTGEIAHEARK